MHERVYVNGMVWFSADSVCKYLMQLRGSLAQAFIRLRTTINRPRLAGDGAAGTTQ